MLCSIFSSHRCPNVLPQSLLWLNATITLVAVKEVNAITVAAGCYNHLCSRWSDCTCVCVSSVTKLQMVAQIATKRKDQPSQALTLVLASFYILHLVVLLERSIANSAMRSSILSDIFGEFSSTPVCILMMLSMTSKPLRISALTDP